MIKIVVSEVAAQSIVEQKNFYCEQQGQELADRWESSVVAAFRSLLQFPEQGARRTWNSPELGNLGTILVQGFSRHLIFYRYEEEFSIVYIVQVMHGARNLETILSDVPPDR